MTVIPAAAKRWAGTQPLKPQRAAVAHRCL